MLRQLLDTLQGGIRRGHRELGQTCRLWGTTRGMQRGLGQVHFRLMD